MGYVTAKIHLKMKDAAVLLREIALLSSGFSLGDPMIHTQRTRRTTKRGLGADDAEEEIKDSAAKLPSRNAAKMPPKAPPEDCQSATGMRRRKRCQSTAKMPAKSAANVPLRMPPRCRQSATGCAAKEPRGPTKSTGKTPPKVPKCHQERRQNAARVPQTNQGKPKLDLARESDSAWGARG